jgi:hypothetical protein
VVGNHFRNRGHPDGIGAETAAHTYLQFRSLGRQANIDALPQSDPLFPGECEGYPSFEIMHGSYPGTAVRARLGSPDQVEPVILI